MTDNLKEREAFEVWAKQNGYGSSMLKTHAQIGWDAAIEYARAALAQAQSCVPAEPPFGSKRNAALALYRPPFKFLHGYIYDADGKMCADEGAMPEHVAARVRGWGRIGYMPDAEALQDEVGQMIAEALTSFWLAASPQPQPVQPREHARAQRIALNSARLAPVTGSVVISSAAYIELYEAAAPQPVAQPGERWHVGDSAFESWFSEYDPAGKGDKQRARDAYAAGMGERATVTQAKPEQAAQPMTRDQLFEFWDKCDAIPGDSIFPGFAVYAEELIAEFCRINGITLAAPQPKD